MDPKSGKVPALRAAWERVRHAFEPVSGVSPPSPADIARLEHDLQGYFRQYEPQSRLQLPADYRDFLLVVGNRLNRGGTYGHWWYLPESVLAETQYWHDLYADAWREHRRAVGWVLVAHYSDKHDIYLCCNPDLARYGHVIDCHDDAPWGADHDHWAEAESFTGYLAGWGDDVASDVEFA